ncbi:hypothetical protein A3I34_00290 [Candidatus Jorgensenbacteria bacterium RIFCSPLOWO2_02_FULL_45_12]|uniref:Preprotein translocase subunit YidC n=2 Tax=Parcubacteria group TaxID=1794811 RepID=A0A0G1U4C7_9BACT|nr:MAG: Preprotein translocase subunit YidC [Candidatus Wolfebacteria bacterium GW2011_GWA2_47_9b]OGG38532.1 MAG: hypothetical protein A3D55_03190 [Candidatus Jorgensenbacteria bacterium RIFCSPHIGHO2_02_FULL_45_20]OGG42364.1 MAG: hypothetical protein A3I34_00290 [Candidatus Jorgensenbacteria bacterium RIFCSPLOWO2_02_FULL_45_12]
MTALFYTFIYEPILSVLVFIYRDISFGDLGLAIIILTILVRIVLFPIFYKSAKDQTVMQKLQPKAKEIQNKYKTNKEEQAKVLMALYKENKFNPLSGFLFLLIQLPIFIALFGVFSHELSNPAFDSVMFFGFINLGERSVVIAIIAAALQYIQGKMMVSSTKPAIGTVSQTNQADRTASQIARAGSMMTIVAPAITLVFLFNLPSALGVYWGTSTAFSVIQQIYINKKINKEKK